MVNATGFNVIIVSIIQIKYMIFLLVNPIWRKSPTADISSKNKK